MNNLYYKCDECGHLHSSDEDYEICPNCQCDTFILMDDHDIVKAFGVQYMVDEYNKRFWNPRVLYFEEE